MDTTDPLITFDQYGVCNYCQNYQQEASKYWFPSDEGRQRLDLIISSIKKKGKNKKYDCILGLSGGIDSSYLALKVYEYGLRPLVVHIDAGWNSELAVSNIMSLVKYCNYDLHTVVINWDEMRSLHLSYLRSGIANQDVPQDHIFFSSLYHFAVKNGIKSVLSGGNFATESIMPESWEGSAMDSISLKAIHRKFGHQRLLSYRTISMFEIYFWFPIVRGMRTYRLLNYIPYNKSVALDELKRTVNFKPYPRKHGESIFTKFFQNYYLPTKYGYDKRRPHLSSLILAGQISRSEALDLLSQPLYDPVELQADITYFCKKLRISRAEFDQFMSLPNKSYLDFPNWSRRYALVKRVQSKLARITAWDLKVYS